MKALIPFSILVGFAVAVLVMARPAESNVGAAHVIAQEMAGVPGPLVGLNSCTVTVDDNPDGGTDLVQCSDSVGHSEIYCENRATTAVYYGGATDDLDSVAPCISSDSATCPNKAFKFSLRKGVLAADTASGSATLYCTEGR